MQAWNRLRLYICGLALLFAACERAPHFRKGDAPLLLSATDAERRFEGDIALMEQHQADSPAVEDAIVFTGSSSITRWNSLGMDMAPFPVANRGFGGSGIRQVSYYLDRILLPLQPRTIFFYCGENDICNEASSASQPMQDFKDFVLRIREHFPSTRIVYISMKPSPLRWQFWPKFQQANTLVRKFIEEERDLRYVDVSAAMLDSTGRPHRGIWLSDSLHMNAEGYAIWTNILKPVVQEEHEIARRRRSK